jgi:UDP-3-O-[3-hydroxymyristoyl] glucosamine N-acyltransferase
MPGIKLAQIAERVGGKLSGDPDIEIDGVAQIDKAGKGKITFLANPKYKQALQNSRASAVIIDQKAEITPSIPFILVADAYYGFLQTFLLFNPTKKILEDGVHPTAVVHDSARVGADASIGANAFIGAGVVVGSKSQIFPNCVILSDSKLGEDCTLYPSVTVRENCTIGNRVIIHNGAVIGSDGFGFAFHEGKYHKIPQVGKVVIRLTVRPWVRP